jgi:hypothetical protein
VEKTKAKRAKRANIEKGVEETALQARNKKLKPYLSMLSEIMADAPERRQLANHLYRLVIMTETANLDVAISVADWLEEQRKPRLQLVKTAPPPLISKRAG